MVPFCFLVFLVGLWTDGVSGEGVMSDETAEGCVRCWVYIMVFYAIPSDEVYTCSGL